MVGSLVLAGVGLIVAVLFPGALDMSDPSSGRPGPPIEGAPGYTTLTGPRGGSLPVGRPWGRACQPIRFSVNDDEPDDVYDQVALVIMEARRHGLNVTIENRKYYWNPASVYYPPGTTIDDVRRVAVFSDNDPPPKLADGRPERVKLVWTTTRDGDGHHEDLTHVEGNLRLAALRGDLLAQRTAIRQIVAFTQGVDASELVDSGIKRGTTLDAFSAVDVAAMKVMSGCGPSTTIPPD